MVDKVLNRVAVHAEVQIDNKGVEERVDVLEDAVGQQLLVTLGKELLETVLAQPLVLCYHVKIVNESWVLPVQREVLHSVLLLLELVLVRSCLSRGTKTQNIEHILELLFILEKLIDVIMKELLV